MVHQNQAVIESIARRSVPKTTFSDGQLKDVC